jgi:hypothetical protein
MRLFLECKPDETLATTLGVPPKFIIHSHGKGKISKCLSNCSSAIALIDEDPGAAVPTYLKNVKSEAERNQEPGRTQRHDIRVYIDKKRDNCIIELSPRLEEWRVQTAKDAGLKMTDFGFESDQGTRLHAEINQRLNNLKQLVEALRHAKSPRLLRLQELLKQD